MSVNRAEYLTLIFRSIDLLHVVGFDYETSALIWIVQISALKSSAHLIFKVLQLISWLLLSSLELSAVTAFEYSLNIIIEPTQQQSKHHQKYFLPLAENENNLSAATVATFHFIFRKQLLSSPREFHESDFKLRRNDRPRGLQ